jgi:hypothetical protein
MTRHLSRAARVLLLVLSTAAERPQAAEALPTLRDPMQPPAAARAAPVSVGEAPLPVAVAPHQLMVVDGRRYVVVGSRRRGVGDLLGDARIERIEDAAVVVRSAAGTQRLPLFGGVTKQAAAAPSAHPSATPPASTLAREPTPAPVRPSSPGNQP